MEVPLTIADHLRRASLVYGDRIGIIDEPDQVAPSLGKLTYRRFEELSSGLAAGLDDLGIDLGLVWQSCRTTPRGCSFISSAPALSVGSQYPSTFA